MERHVVVARRCELLHLQPQKLSEGERDADGCGVGCDVKGGVVVVVVGRDGGGEVCFHYAVTCQL